MSGITRRNDLRRSPAQERNQSWSGNDSHPEPKTFSSHRSARGGYETDFGLEYPAQSGYAFNHIGHGKTESQPGKGQERNMQEWADRDRTKAERQRHENGWMQHIDRERSRRKPARDCISPIEAALKPRHHPQPQSQTGKLFTNCQPQGPKVPTAEIDFDPVFGGRSSQKDQQ